MDHRTDQRLRPGLADVLHLTFLALAAVKAVDVHLDHGPAWAAIWLAACALSVVARRFGFASLTALAFGLWATADAEMVSTSAVLIGLVALILAADIEVDRLLWSQTIAVYLFATLNKLNADYFDGSAIISRAEWLPFPVAFSVVGVLVEGWLAWAVWRRHRWAFPVAVIAHVGIVVVMGSRPYQWLMLGAYNALVVLLVWWATRASGAGACAAESRQDELVAGS